MGYYSGVWKNYELLLLHLEKLWVTITVFGETMG